MSSLSPQSDPAFRLVMAVQELSLARTLDRVREIVSRAARDLTGADGATFVLKDGGFCHYADEDAVSPLWKGRRFPLDNCVSGWVMSRGEPLAIEHIYEDPRVPADAYRPTFVKSLALVPIRKAEPIGAIGNYWASPHAATERELLLLQALADSTSVAMENVKVYAELEQRVKDRTAELERANRDLESFSSAVSHDLRAPLRHISGYASMMENLPAGSPRAGEMLGKIQSAAGRMNVLIDDMLKLARISMSSLPRQVVDLSAMAQECLNRLKQADPERNVRIVVTPGLRAEGDPGWIRIALENLLANAWKFTSKNPAAEVEFGVTDGEVREFFVRDNGSGFDMRFADRLFQPFIRLHAQTEFPGNGIGLATIRRIVEKHGGSIRAEAEVDKGARFYFTLGSK